MNQMVVFIYIYEENSYFLQVCIPFYYIMPCQVRRFSNRSTHVLRKGDLCRIGKGTLTKRNHTFIWPKKLSFIVRYAYMFNFRRPKTFLYSPLRSFKFQCTYIELLLLFPHIRHRFICRPSDYTCAGIEAATGALAWQSDALTMH